ncbi:probable cytochrome P450 12a4, mitochondrial [Teleopsis dalmanni]|uniref:probable cytochrome P450 12a4, mitochondrial n=1 Tax=Teleopsis dalmanni TaxID=139649 RepID=UPI0018CF503F|nr:probable cytochrome P450 12a4, mitochondrial [Teleopsis dalmanni]
MLLTKNCFTVLNLRNSRCLSLSTLRLIQSTQLTLQQVQASEANLDTDLEWSHAKPFTEIPTNGTFNSIRELMPGGKHYKKNFIKYLSELKEDYGDVFLMPAMLGREAILITHNPEDFERVFRNEGIWPLRPGSKALRYHREKHRADFFENIEGLISTQGEKWGNFRSAVNPVLMQPKNVKLYLQKMSQVNCDFVDRIKEIRDPRTLEVPDNFEEEINRWTLESVSIVALDKQLGLLKENRDNKEAKQLFNNLTEFFTLSLDLELKPPVWKFVLTPTMKAYLKCLDNIQNVTLSYVNEAIERLEKEHEAGIEKPDNQKSVIEKLLKINKKLATVMAMDMLMAGVDTTSSAFTGIMLCLAKNPEKQEKLREEILKILPDKTSDFTDTSLKNMPYLRACIKESLRLYPVVELNARTPQRDVVLSGYQVPKGTQVSMVSTTLRKNEKYYTKAEEFIPERWLRQNKDSENQSSNELKVTNPFIYLPFGFGSRSCIGKRVVEMELELGIARIIRNFKVEFNHPVDEAFKALIINVPNIPLKFKFTDV